MIEKQDYQINFTWQDILLDKKQIQPWFTQYIYAYYFITTTIVTVGYGDQVPKTQTEIIFAIITMLLGSGLFGYSLNKIGSIFQDQLISLKQNLDLNKDEDHVKEILMAANIYMNKKGINQDLKYQINEYLNYYCKETILKSNALENQVIAMLSEPLREKLQIEANKIVFIESNIFKNNFSKEIIQKLITVISEICFAPEQLIFRQNDIDDNSIYFIQSGQCEQFVEGNQIQIIKYFNQGQSFGVTEFFTGQPRSNSIRCTEFCTLIKIKREDFIKILQDSPADYEKFCQIKDNIVLNMNYQCIQQQCLSCNQYSHLEEQCPIIHFIPNRQKLFYIINRSIPISERIRQFQRYRKKKLNTFLNLNLQNDRAEEYYEINYEYIENSDWYQQIVLENDFYERNLLVCNEELKENYNDEQSIEKNKIDQDQKEKQYQNQKTNISIFEEILDNQKINDLKENCLRSSSQLMQQSEDNRERSNSQKTYNQEINYDKDDQILFQRQNRKLKTQIVKTKQSINQKIQEKNIQIIQQISMKSENSQISKNEEGSAKLRKNKSLTNSLKKTQSNFSQKNILTIYQNQSFLKPSQQMECMKLFTDYYPHNNYNVVLIRYNYQNKYERKRGKSPKLKKSRINLDNKLNYSPQTNKICSIRNNIISMQSINENQKNYIPIASNLKLQDINLDNFSSNKYVKEIYQYQN